MKGFVFEKTAAGYALTDGKTVLLTIAAREGATDLIPECQRNQTAHPYFSTMGIIAGFAAMMLLDVMLG